MNTVIYEADYIVGTANTSFGTDENADKIERILRHQPKAEDGYVYKLRADTLEWELIELPEPEPIEDEEATTEDYEAALAELGVR